LHPGIGQLTSTTVLPVGGRFDSAGSWIGCGAASNFATAAFASATPDDAVLGDDAVPADDAEPFEVLELLLPQPATIKDTAASTAAQHIFLIR
jgi:hypothetical protein